MTKENLTINWTAIAALVPLILVTAGWAISIEVRMSQQSNIQNIQDELNGIKEEMHQQTLATSNNVNGFTSEVRGLTRRIQNLEEVLVPILVDYKVRKELETKEDPKPQQVEEDAEAWAKKALKVKK